MGAIQKGGTKGNKVTAFQGKVMRQRVRRQPKRDAHKLLSLEVGSSGDTSGAGVFISGVFSYRSYLYKAIEEVGSLRENIQIEKRRVSVK